VLFPDVISMPILIQLKFCRDIATFRSFFLKIQEVSWVSEGTVGICVRARYSGATHLTFYLPSDHRWRLVETAILSAIKRRPRAMEITRGATMRPSIGKIAALLVAHKI
jgi:hypothetical protein